MFCGIGKPWLLGVTSCIFHISERLRESQRESLWLTLALSSTLSGWISLSFSFWLPSSQFLALCEACNFVAIMSKTMQFCRHFFAKKCSELLMMMIIMGTPWVDLVWKGLSLLPTTPSLSSDIWLSADDGFKTHSRESRSGWWNPTTDGEIQVWNFNY